MQEHSNPSNKPSTYQTDLTKLPRALAPLLERPQWAVWRWTRLSNGRWQKPPFQALDPQRHASSSDPDTWSDYTTALATVQAGKADGISYVMTKDDPFAAIDVDHCRDADIRSFDAWVQNFLDVGHHTYNEITPSGTGYRIWGLTAPGSDPVHRKFTLAIEDKEVAVELFRRTGKILTITGSRLNSNTFTNIDRVIQWAMVWGERRKAAAAEAVIKLNGYNSFNGGAGHDINEIEQIVREGAPVGVNRSDKFHTIVGHYIGCGWPVDRIHDHMKQFPDGIGSRYLREDRLLREISRSAEKFNARILPLLSGMETPQPRPSAEAPRNPPPAVDPDTSDDDDPALDIPDDDLGTPDDAQRARR